VTIRHVSGHRIVALVEILSPANKDRAEHVDEFVDKVEDALRHGVHLLVLDLFPPGRHDPQGMHGAVWRRLDEAEEPLDPPADEPLTLAAYVADLRPDAYLDYVALGRPLPAMPLFLTRDHYLNAPLEATYDAAWRGMPAYWRAVVEGEAPPSA
jgi:hypothetical protein